MRLYQFNIEGDKKHKQTIRISSSQRILALEKKMPKLLSVLAYICIGGGQIT